MPIEEFEYPKLRPVPYNRPLSDKELKQTIQEIEYHLGVLRMLNPYNQILNGNFANYPTTPGIAPNWTAIATATFSRQTQKSGNSPAGYIMRVQAVAINDGCQQTINVKPSTTYTFSGWLKRNSGTGNITIRLLDNGASAIQQDIKLAPASWVFLPTAMWGSLQIRTASDATQLTLKFILDTATDTYDLSDLVITEGNWYPTQYIQYTGAEAIDHGNLIGLGDNDHTQYALKSGSITQITTRNHSDLQGLTTGDDHTQYALLAGRAGGQTLIGGTAASEKLTLQSTSHATKGKIWLPGAASGYEMVWDEANSKLGIRDNSPNDTASVISIKNFGGRAIRALSSSLSSVMYWQLGRTQDELSIGVVGASDQFFTGTVAGDTCFRSDINGSQLYIGIATNPILRMVRDYMAINTAPSNTAFLKIGGSFTGATSAFGLDLNNTLITTGAGYSVYGQRIVITAGGGSTNLAGAAGLGIDPIVKGTTGTITDIYGQIIEAQNAVCTNGYGLYVLAPTGGSTKNVTAYFQGRIGIGTNAPALLLHVSGGSTTQPAWGANDVAVFENVSTLSTAVQVLSANNKSGLVSFSDDVKDVGYVKYNHSTNIMIFNTNAGAGILNLDSSGHLYPTGNKTQDLGATGSRWNNIYYVTATTGTSRIVQSTTICKTCNEPMERGTGGIVRLGVTEDYTDCYCAKCGCIGREILKHLQPEKLLEKKQPNYIKFKGFRVLPNSGNSRNIMIDFQYSDDIIDSEENTLQGIKNSTLFGETELEAFKLMTKEQQLVWLKEVGQREWDALEESRLMTEQCKEEQTELDGLLEKELVL